MGALGRPGRPERLARREKVLCVSALKVSEFVRSCAFHRPIENALGREIVRVVQRHHVDMGMGDIESRHEQADFKRVEELALRASDPLGQGEDVMALVVGQVPEVGLMPPGHDQHVAGPDGADIQEGHCEGGLQEGRRAGRSRGDAAKGTSAHWR